MKKINLIEWLSRNSHEKQSPQRFARYAAILIMLLTLGVGQMWAKIVYYNDEGQSGTPRIHYWGGNSPAGTAWDSDPNMVNVSGNIYAFDIGDHTSVIFRYNNGNNQTGDLTVPTDGKNYISTKDGNTWSTLSTFTASSTLYLLVNSNWKTVADNHAPRYAACFLGKTGQTWVSCSQVGTSDYYYVTVPSTNEYPFVIFCRMNGNNNTNNWSNVYNQTSDLAPSSGNNGVEITGWSNSSSWITVRTGISVSRTPTAAANAPTITNNQTVVKSGSSVTINAQTEKTGYHWVNWTKTNGTLGNANNKSTTFTPSANSASAVANYALNQQKVKFYGRGNTGGSMSDQTYTYGVAQALTSNAFTKTGYTFGGWATSDENAAAGTVAHANGASITLNPATHLPATYDLYAIWIPGTYDVTLDPDEGSSTKTVVATYGAAMPSKYKNSETSVAAPTFSGYAFQGYYDDHAGAGTQYYNSSAASARTWNKASTATLYAKWTQTVELNKNTNAAGATSGSAGVTYKKSGKTSFTAASRTGYTCDGYYTAASNGYLVIAANGTMQSTNANISSYIGASDKWVHSGATTLYAYWTANSYTVTLQPNGATTGSTQTVTAIYDAAMPSTTTSSTAVTAPSKTGYSFTGFWDNSTNGSGKKYYNADLSSANTWDKTANTNLYAHWTAKTYTVTLDKQTGVTGYGGNAGTVANQTVTFDATLATVSGTMPSAADGYAFMGFYSEEGGNGRRFIDQSGNWVTSAGDTISGGHWVKPAGITLYAYYKKAEITALTLDNAVVAPSASVGVTPTVAPTPTGTNSICWKLLYSNGNLYSPQPTFSPASPAGISNKVTFTAPPTSGTYLIAAVLRTGNECNGGTKLDSVTSAFQVAGDHTVTVQYKDAEGNTLQASGTVNGRPLVWSSAITAPDIFGYTFHHWLAGDGITLSEDGIDAKTGERADSSVVSSIYIKAIYDGKLTAVYNQKQMIYFKNTLEWSSVYVNFYGESGYWDDKGSGNKTVDNRNKAMTRIEDTDIWYYDYGTAGITPTRYVSFTEDEQNGEGDGAQNFWKAGTGENVVYPARRADDLADKAGAIGFYAATPMFVPLVGQTPVVKNSTGTGQANYYNSGYWTKYTSGTGYTLEVYYDSDSSEKIKDIAFSSADELMPLAAVANLEASRTYRFQIKRAGDVYYGNAGTMTYANHGQSVAWEMSNEATRRNDANTENVFAKCKITTTAAGDYTFNLSYSGDNSKPVQYRLRMEVDYPIADGDYRLIYTDATRDSGTRYKPSAIVTKAANHKDTVSFFIRPKSSPVMKIQQSSVTNEGAITWTDHITITSEITDARCPKDSVYNICLTMNESGDISVENVEGYTGIFYIRTDAAGASKWDNYRAADHLMTYSEYSKTYSDYTHYFMAYVAKDKNVKFVVANDYSPCISDTLVQSTFRGGDSYHVDDEGDIKADANVRFMWNRSNNAVYRAYLDKAKSDGSRFLVLRANSNTDLMDENGNALLQASTSEQAGYNHGAPDNSIQFVDNENWIYETNVKVRPGAFVKLYAHFHDKDFYYRGNNNNMFNGTEVDGVPNAIQLITGEGDAVKVRVVYDFKTDRLLAAWMPEGEIDDTKAINADVMFVREGQGDIAQLTFTESGEISAIKTAYGVMKFNKWTLNNKDKSTHTVLSSPASIYERSLFWISFPFRVKLSEVFGFGTYGVDWAIQRYDGAERAEKGFWAESSGFWKWMDRNTEYLEPNQGYLLAIDLDLLGESASVWNNGVENVELYFPSYGTMPSITSADVEHTLPSHACTIDWSGRSNGNGGTLGLAYNRTVIDSHWNVMSVPTYVNTSNVSFANTDWTEPGDGKHGPNFLYTWNASDNTLTPTAGAGYHYHAMHAYMVQYHGDVTWTASSGSPYPIVARRTYAEQPKKVNFCLEIQQNDKMLDRTFVQLSDDEEVSAEFNFGEDMGKEFNSRKANIYTVIENYLRAAGNTLPMSDQTTLVPVGVKTTAAGEYTFAMPEGTSGVSVVLIDNIAGTRTNLALSDYTVALGKGDLSDRFMLEIAPIKQMPTDIENVQGGDVQGAKARKVMIDGILYIVKDGKVFDARGAKVK